MRPAIRGVARQPRHPARRTRCVHEGVGQQGLDNVRSVLQGPEPQTVDAATPLLRAVLSRRSDRPRRRPPPLWRVPPRAFRGLQGRVVRGERSRRQVTLRDRPRAPPRSPDGATQQADVPGAAQDLPLGTIVEHEGDPYLLWRSGWFEWTPRGYEKPSAARPAVVEVLTPRSIVAILRRGFSPQVHPSADGKAESGGGAEST